MMCLSAPALMMFLHMAGVGFSGHPLGVLVHAQAGPVLYVRHGAAWCMGGVPA